ncbi:MAG: GNAT family N-acetyltransferase [Pseudomonadota bacterium]|nr:GNAT family N-acetyltransferase [Pseudomonadota bacterium]
MSSDIVIRTDLRSGDLGRLIALHGTAYEGEGGHFGLVFEAFVARTVAEFVIDNKAKGRIFLAERGDALVACAAMVAREGGRGQLRWVLASPAARGLGLGKKLVGAAIDYARNEGWREVFLETTDGLDASMDIYRKLGFEVTGREVHALWADANEVITMTLKLR